MLIQFGLDDFQAPWSHAVVCVGKFDGIHLGHQALIRKAIQLAEQREQPAVVVTFDRNPLAVLSPSQAPLHLATMEINLRLIAKLGPAATTILTFNHAMATTTAEAFFYEILITKLRANQMVVGHDFTFGHQRVGNGTWLEQRIATEIVGAIEVNGLRVSSGEIRKFLLAGEIERAAELLGAAPIFSGVVVAGEKLGRQLGYPTANLAAPSDLIIPKDGIYAAHAETPFGNFKAAVSIGIRPTVGGTNRTVEAFLIDYEGPSLYGRTINLEWKMRLRDELKFEDLEALKTQMAHDVADVRRLLD